MIGWILEPATLLQQSVYTRRQTYVHGTCNKQHASIRGAAYLSCTPCLVSPNIPQARLLTVRQWHGYRPHYGDMCTLATQFYCCVASSSAETIETLHHMSSLLWVRASPSICSQWYWHLRTDICIMKEPSCTKLVEYQGLRNIRSLHCIGSRKTNRGGSMQLDAALGQSGALTRYVKIFFNIFTIRAQVTTGLSATGLIWN